MSNPPEAVRIAEPGGFWLQLADTGSESLEVIDRRQFRQWRLLDRCRAQVYKYYVRPEDRAVFRRLDAWDLMLLAARNNERTAQGV